MTSTLPFDIHTHSLRKNAIVNITPDEDITDGYFFSCGIHPWIADKATSHLWQRLEQHLTDKRVIAVGETGLDALRGPSLNIQENVFLRHIAFSEHFDKPLIIHCVKCWHKLLELKKELCPRQKWIIHGFRGGPQLATQLIKAGMEISFGPKFNPATPAIISADKLHVETDDDPAADITRITAAVYKAINKE